MTQLYTIHHSIVIKSKIPHHIVLKDLYLIIQPIY